MRLLSFVGPLGPTWGLQVDGGVVPADRLGADVPSSLQALLVDAERWPGWTRDLPARAASAAPLPIDSVELLPCVPRPGKMICLGVNYVDHAKEGGNQIGDYPALFLRCATSLLAHGAPLRVPKVSSKLDFEAELAVVIGRTCALRQRGRCAGRRVRLRLLQRRHAARLPAQDHAVDDRQELRCHRRLRPLPGHAPTSCRRAASGLRIESRLNGEVMQSANTADMAFGVARTIALLSESLTLEPGDVVVMGTPGGVGYARTPPVWMKAGDTIEIEIEGIGVLANPVTD